MTVEEEQYLAVSAMRTHMRTAWQAGQLNIAQEAENILSQWEEMTPEQWQKRFPPDNSDIA